MSFKREVSEKNRKFNSNWEQTTVSCEVASNIRSERVFVEALQHQTREDI